MKFKKEKNVPSHYNTKHLFINVTERFYPLSCLISDKRHVKPSFLQLDMCVCVCVPSLLIHTQPIINNKYNMKKKKPQI